MVSLAFSRLEKLSSDKQSDDSFIAISLYRQWPNALRLLEERNRPILRQQA